MGDNSQKYQWPGIDPRQIKCSCHNPNCRQSGISFDDKYLFFHFLEMDKGKIIDKSRSMVIDEETALAIIRELMAFIPGKRLLIM